MTEIGGRKLNVGFLQFVDKNILYSGKNVLFQKRSQKFCGFYK